MLNHIMKKFWSLMVVALVTLGAGFTSCSDDDGPKGPSTTVTTPSQEDGTITATTATFTFTTNGVTELAYKAVKAEESVRAAVAPEAELIFAEAEKTFPMQDGENKVVVEGAKELRGCVVEAKELRGGASLVLAGLVANDKTTINNIKYIDRGYEELENTLVELGAKIRRL